jgi:hypothetical protein
MAGPVVATCTVDTGGDAYVWYVGSASTEDVILVPGGAMKLIGMPVGGWGGVPAGGAYVAAGGMRIA